MKKGFTLIEVIIVIALIGILSLILTSIVAYSLNNYKMSKEKHEEQFDVRLAADLITLEVRNALSISLISSAGGTGTKYLYYADNDLIMVDEDGAEVNFTNGKIQGITFELIESSIDHIFLEFNVTGINGYAVNSAVLLNNMASSDIEESTDVVVAYTLP
ncbi:MAG: type II secretion system protein [Clostridiales bacterium]|nr:type II secretion system protein [Clostridiales bacterium]